MRTTDGGEGTKEKTRNQAKREFRVAVSEATYQFLRKQMARMECRSVSALLEDIIEVWCADRRTDARLRAERAMDPARHAARADTDWED